MALPHNSEGMRLVDLCSNTAQSAAERGDGGRTPPTNASNATSLCVWYHARKKREPPDVLILVCSYPSILAYLLMKPKTCYHTHGWMHYFMCCSNTDDNAYSCKYLHTYSVPGIHMSVKHFSVTCT